MKHQYFLIFYIARETTHTHIKIPKPLFSSNILKNVYKIPYPQYLHTGSRRYTYGFSNIRSDTQIRQFHIVLRFLFDSIRFQKLKRQTRFPKPHL